jgi:PAS domain S-box-containing protein
VRDITVRRQAEMDLRESESRYRFLVEQFLAGIYIIQDGRFRYVNPGFAAIFRYGSPGELIERVSFTELVAPEDRERVAENIRRRVAGEISDMHYMFKALRGDGSPFDVEVHGRAFEYQGRPAVIGMLLDITERKLAEAALAEREAGYRAVIETAADGFWIADDQGRLLAVNDAYVRRSG